MPNHFHYRYLCSAHCYLRAYLYTKNLESDVRILKRLGMNIFCFVDVKIWQISKIWHIPDIFCSCQFVRYPKNS